MRVGAMALLLVAASVGTAGAQSASSTASQYSKGYGQGAGGFAQPVNPSIRDANGNLTIVDGVIQAGSGSMFGKLNVGGVQDQFTGAGSTTGASGGAAGTATAIGNNLVVVTEGSYNTVVVNATQTNNGAVTATTTVLNGKVNLGGGQ
jgi:holdfast attachment protein HfaA